MKSYRDYKVDRLFSEEVDIDVSRIMGPTSALGTGTQRPDPRVVARLRTVMDDISEEYPEPAEALQEIIKAATMLLGRTGWSFNPKQMRRSMRIRGNDSEVEPRELPGDDEEDL